MNMIIPVSGASQITPFQSAFTPQKTGGASPFRDMFSGAVSNLEELNAIKDQDAIALSLGNIDDIGAMQVNSEKADTALQLLIQMRNKVLESYQEIMRISI